MRISDWSSDVCSSDVRKLVCRLTAMRIDSHTGSWPMMMSDGTTSGSRMTEISTKSRKEPSRKINAMTNSSEQTAPTVMTTSSDYECAAQPRPRNTSANTLAVMMVAKIMEGSVR